MEMVKDALDQLRGAVMIVYPMGLPPYDPIRMEFENKEDLSGTQVCGAGWGEQGPRSRSQAPGAGLGRVWLSPSSHFLCCMTTGSPGSHSGVGGTAVVGCQGAEKNKEAF